jgi:hypothetical protein
VFHLSSFQVDASPTAKTSKYFIEVKSMIYYKGSEYKGDQVTAVPGYSSSRIAEAAEYAVPALYRFEFDETTLKPVETVNGKDHDPIIRSIKPGAVGIDDPNEVIINTQVKMMLLTGDELIVSLEEIKDDTVSSDPIRTLEYIISAVLENKDIFQISDVQEQKLLALLINNDED